MQFYNLATLFSIALLPVSVQMQCLGLVGLRVNPKFKLDFKLLVTYERWLPLSKRNCTGVDLVPSLLVAKALTLCSSTVSFLPDVVLVITSELCGVLSSITGTVVPVFNGVLNPPQIYFMMSLFAIVECFRWSKFMTTMTKAEAHKKSVFSLKNFYVLLKIGDSFAWTGIMQFFAVHTTNSEILDTLTLLIMVRE